MQLQSYSEHTNTVARHCRSCTLSKVFVIVRRPRTVSSALSHALLPRFSPRDATSAACAVAPPRAASMLYRQSRLSSIRALPTKLNADDPLNLFLPLEVLRLTVASIYFTLYYDWVYPVRPVNIMTKAEICNEKR